MDVIESFKGDSWEIELSILDEDGNVPSGIENYNAKYSLSKRPNGSDEDNVIATDEVTLSISALGVITGIVDPDITKLVPSGKYVEQIRLATVDGTIVQTFERYRNVKSVNYIPETPTP